MPSNARYFGFVLESSLRWRSSASCCATSCMARVRAQHAFIYKHRPSLFPVVKAVLFLPLLSLQPLSTSPSGNGGHSCFFFFSFESLPEKFVAKNTRRAVQSSLQCQVEKVQPFNLLLAIAITKPILFMFNMEGSYPSHSFLRGQDNQFQVGSNKL